jgi:hypothetical protein
LFFLIFYVNLFFSKKINDESYKTNFSFTTHHYRRVFIDFFPSSSSSLFRISAVKHIHKQSTEVANLFVLFYCQKNKQNRNDLIVGWEKQQILHIVAGFYKGDINVTTTNKLRIFIQLNWVCTIFWCLISDKHNNNHSRFWRRRHFMTCPHFNLLLDMHIHIYTWKIRSYPNDHWLHTHLWQ